MSEGLKKEKDVKVRITTDVEGEQFVMTARGEYARDDEAHYVAYTEYAGNEVTRSGLHAAREKLYLHRSGAVTSDMLFDPRCDTRCRYQTMGMEMAFVVHTTQYDVIFGEKGFVIDLCYSLREENGGNFAEYRLKIEVDDA